jgi:hypothetical protein
MIYYHTKFHMLSSSGSLVIPTIPKAITKFRSAAMLLSHTLRETILTKSKNKLKLSLRLTN